MKILQNNNNNITGFTRLDNTDFGVDENGDKAFGYQHHDALWWNENNITNPDAQHIATKNEIMDYFNSIFPNIAKNIIDTINPKVVLELGSGSGQLCYELRKLNPGLITVTVDANKNSKSSPYIDSNHFIARTDKDLCFTYSHDNSKVVFDLIISLEHFEHIQENTFNILMSNIHKHSIAGSYLVFTAAQWEYPGDKNHVHCNAQKPQYWIEYINKHKFDIIPNMFKINRGGSTTEIFATKQ